MTRKAKPRPQHDQAFLGALSHGSPRIEWVTGWMLLREHELAKGSRSLLGHSSVVCSPYISRNRNQLTRQCLQSGCRWLLMIDHDVYVPETLLEIMVAAACEVEAGVLAVNHALGSSCPATGFINTENPLIFQVAKSPVRLAKVETIASSIVMVDRRVFDKITAVGDAAPYFGRGCWWMHWPQKDLAAGVWEELGEDFSFSRRARAVGEDLWVLYGLEEVVQHYKVHKVSREKKS